MDILNATKDYADCISGGAITTPTGGTWVSAAALYLGATAPINGSWLQALCVAEGVTAPVNGSWVIALANHYGVSQPKNNSWWYAIADDACNGAPPLPPPFIWNLDTKNWEAETREWGIQVVANFTADNLTPTAGDTVNYTDTSTGAASSWSWSFPGGTPSTSSLQNPSIVYNTAGIYDAELTASNLSTSDTELKTNYINVASGLDPDAQAFITAAGVTDPTQISAVDQLVLDLKAAAIWSKMQIIYPFVGPVGDINSRKYNLKDPRDLDAAYRLSFNGTFSAMSTGVASNGNLTDYADTHWVPNAQTFTNGVHWSNNVYAEAGTSEYNMGIAAGIFIGDWAIINDYGGNNLDYWQAGQGGYLTSTTASGIGYTLGTSNGTNFRGLYVDGVLAASDTNGSINSSNTGSAYLWSVNNAGSPSNPSADTSNFTTIGEYLDATEQAALHSAMITFNTTLGR